MPPSTVDPARQRTLRATTDALRRLGAEEMPSAPSPQDDEAMTGWIAAVRKVLSRSSKVARRELAVAQAQVKAGARSSGVDEAGWKRLEDACRRLEQELLSPGSLRSRLDEGRRSMMPRVEAVVGERVVPVVEETGGQLSAELDRVGLAELERELPLWVKAWSEYAFGWLDVDQERLVHQLWSPRAGDLPVPPPEFPPLAPAIIDRGIEFPLVAIQRERTALSARMMRHGRSILYGLMSITFLLGVKREGMWFYALLVPGFLVAVGFGYVQAQAERQRERERLSQEARQKAEQATREVLRTWFDRCQDKLNERAREQLLERRDLLVTWYRETVAPARSRREQDTEKRQGLAERARRDLPRLQERDRGIERVRTALTQLEQTLGGGAAEAAR